MIKLYSAFPLGPATEIDLNDFFTGNGTATTFTLVNKTGTLLNDDVQVGATIDRQSTGTVTVSGNNFTLPAAPTTGTVVTAPGASALEFDAYDQATVAGVTNPLVKERTFIIADMDQIGLYKYLVPGGYSGIQLQFIDHDTSNGAAAGWYQLAPANADGTVGTYGAAGAALDVGAIQNSSTLTANSIALATSITVADGTQFTPGMIIAINYGNPSFEPTTIRSIAGNVLTVDALANAHSSTETVMHCGWWAYGKLIVPAGAAGGQTTVNWDVSLDVIVDQESR